MLLMIPGENVPTNPLQVTAIGVVIAIVFLISIVGVLGWMLRMPKETELTRSATRAVRSVNKLTRVLVPLLHKSEATDRVVALAAQMARQRNGSIEVLAVIEVPFMLPLDASVADDEKRACELLNRALSVAAGRTSRLSKRILKGRHAGPAIVHEAQSQAVDLIILANTPVRVRGNLQPVDPTVDYVMKHAPCEVLVLSETQTQMQAPAHANGHSSDQDGLGTVFQKPEPKAVEVG